MSRVFLLCKSYYRKASSFAKKHSLQYFVGDASGSMPVCYVRFPPPIHRASTRTIFGAFTQIIRTAISSLRFSYSQQQKARCCQRRAQRNEQQLHRQAQKHQQHAGKRHCRPKDPPAPKAPAHAPHSLHSSYAAAWPLCKKRPGLLPAAPQFFNYLPMIFGKVSTFASDTHWVTAAS